MAYRQPFEVMLVRHLDVLGAVVAIDDQATHAMSVAAHEGRTLDLSAGADGKVGEGGRAGEPLDTRARIRFRLARKVVHEDSAECLVRCDARFIARRPRFSYIPSIRVDEPQEAAVRSPLLARFPSLRTPAASRPVIPLEVRAAHPRLAADFEVIDRELTPSFTKYDLIALQDQNRYRRQQVAILLGSSLLAGLGGLQAVLADQRWPGVVLAAIGITLATSSRYARESETLKSYLSARVKAERLRALHFRYLSDASKDRDIVLRRAVHAIRAAKEPE